MSIYKGSSDAHEFATISFHYKWFYHEKRAIIFQLNSVNDGGTDSSGLTLVYTPLDNVKLPQTNIIWTTHILFSVIRGVSRISYRKYLCHNIIFIIYHNIWVNDVSDNYFDGYYNWQISREMKFIV